MTEIINKIWTFINHVCRIVVKIDDAKIQVQDFWDWLFGDEPEEDL